MDSRPRRADFGDAAAPLGSSRNTLIRLCAAEQVASKGYTPLTGRIPPYVYKSGTVITLIDPREPETAITTVVEGEAKEIGLDEWLIQDSQADSELRMLLNSLLHRHL